MGVSLNTSVCPNDLFHKLINILVTSTVKFLCRRILLEKTCDAHFSTIRGKGGVPSLNVAIFLVSFDTFTPVFQTLELSCYCRYVEEYDAVK